MFPFAHRRQSGFTYLSLVILLAIIGLVTASAIKLGAMLQRSKAEQELLLIGAAFSDALQSYAEATPAGQASLPGSLNDLLRDPRFPTPRRHLRKIFADPVTGRVEWGIVYAGDKRGVVAVYSLSNAKPVKLSNFPSRFAGFSGALKISDWKFSAASMTDKTPPSHELAARSSENVASARQSAKKTSETAEGVQTEASDEWAKPGFPSGAAPSSPEAGQIELPSRQNSQ
ncbi:type II secretion system protein [Pseudoduganella danionis]|uniref:type II secretion system protein n=1 Tax=Pseudoduganella danionis TaxID=1890295 RepID=UPI0018B01E29|nr:type II secretion system protein [Pseudoduganella danionis]